jgi:NADH-quinone oxidoreductase subunit L
MDFALQYPYLIPLLPLIGAIIAGFFGARYLKGQSHWPIWLGVGASAVISLGLLAYALGHHGNLHESRTWFEWIKLGGSADGALGDAGKAFVVNFGFYFDPLTCVMLAVVCGIGFLITVFAAGYMKGEAGYYRFFAYLGLFIFMMTNLVMGENLIMLYLGWEGVGLCSYLLIGYYYDKPAAREAAKKAFLVNRIGDFGFALGIMLCFTAFGTVSYFGDANGPGMLQIAAQAATNVANNQAHLNTAWQNAAIDWVPFLLMVGAFGKSAQFPLYVWLPDAMEGPTPVSALIHAATMVTAGVYMIARCGTLFVGNTAAMITIASIGAFTAIFAGAIALRQFDLKKVFAYSTVSQLGFMFVGVGVFAPVAAVFHLVTHAFFKALLFLSSGVVMHAMNGILDLRQMSGLKEVLPKTRWLMLIGCLALAGMVPFSGFFSKDEIIHAAEHGAFNGHLDRLIITAVLLVTAFMTAYYTFRLYFRVFEGPLKVPEAPVHDDHGHGGGHGHDDHGHGGHGHDHGHHNHEPMIMIAPLAILAIGAIFAGFLNWPVHGLGHFLGESQSFKLAYQVASARHAVDPIPMGQPGEAHGLINMVMVISFLIAAAGIFTAYVFHLKDRAAADRKAAGMPGVVSLLDGKFWVDEIFTAGIVNPLRAFGVALWNVDKYLVDGLVALVGWTPQIGGWVLKLGVQRGSLQGYAAAMLFGVVVILVLVFM